MQGTLDNQIASQHKDEVASGERFEFGANWSKFLLLLDDTRIQRAEESLKEKLEVESLAGKRMLDAGSGSGLFSLAARNLGATVHSFDFDPKSVACTRELRRRYYSDDPDWTVEEASVLDPAYLSRLGSFDIVYSWGVLHHTGQMWQALGNVAPLVRDGGLLFVAIYNDQGTPSKRWLAVKRFYNKAPGLLKPVVAGAACLKLWWRSWVKDAVTGKPFRVWRSHGSTRGMSAWRDLVDWVGGYPFEVAKPEQIFDFYRVRGFELCKLATEGGSLGCNEFVFRKTPGQPSSSRNAPAA
ncbi:MAG: class I SAM-dependent methyltransferase [Acidobacteriota bacterium]|nr:class I SAM-dependent methyltransferase [Acidobacteriota bacterium]